MKTKVLFIILNGKEYGGSEKHVVDIINNLDREKYSPYLIMSEGNCMNRNIDETICKNIFYVDRNNPFCLLKMSKIIKKINPNIVHAHAARGIVYARLLCKKKFENVKLICTTHGWILDHLKFNRILQKMFLMNKNVDTITLAVSDYTYNQLIEKGYKKEKVKRIYNGIDINWYSEGIKLRKKIDNIAYIGRLANEKGIVYLMESIKKMRNSEFFFNIYGSGELKEYIQNFIKENSLSNVKLNDFIPAEEVKLVLRKMDLLILPSINEAFPYILVEAMASGLPCVATDVGGVGEIIDDKVGKLVECKNVDVICEAIEDINNKNLEEYSRSCLERSKKFSIEKMVDELEKVYEKI